MGVLIVMITETDLSEFRRQLIERIEMLEHQDVATTQDRATVELDQQSVGRLSRMDALQQQAMAKATQNRRSVEIARAKAALDRIKQGEFGFCTDCGEDISLSRLNQDPSLPLCLDCARSR